MKQLTSQGVLLALLITTPLLKQAQSVQLTTDNVNLAWISSTATTNTYQPNPLYSPCLCDKTALSCDPLCCCDQDCSFALRASWVNNQKCTDHNYDTTNGLPLADCVKQQQLYDYNRQKGIQTYIDPFTKLFCVMVNNAPQMDYYYIAKTSLSSEDIDTLISDTTKQGFVSTLFEADSATSSQLYYSEGDEMYAKLSNGLIPWNRAFSIPKSDMNGFCDSFYAPKFMEATSSECLRAFDVQQQCLDVVNPSYYTDQLVVYAGLSKFSTNINVTINTAYTYDNKTQQYTQITDIDNNFNNSTLYVNTTSNQCSCQGTLKEIEYVVYVTPQNATTTITNPYFLVNSVEANVVINPYNVTATCGYKAAINQKYSVRFVSSDDQIQYRSGNPGYFYGYPVLIGQIDSTTSAVEAYEKGFQLKGADAHGYCYNSSLTPSLFDYGDPTVTFGNDLIHGCGVKLNYAEFMDYCTNSQAYVNALELFQNLNFWSKYGEFGNANIYYPSDWSDLKYDSSNGSLGSQVSWDSTSRTCTLYANVHYKVFYSSMGFSDNPQRYIVDIYRYSIPEEWTYTRLTHDQRQTFNHQVSVQFIEVGAANATNSSYIDPPSHPIPLDVFYPFMIQSKGVWIHASGLLVLFGVLISGLL